MDGWTELNGGVPPFLCWQGISYAETDSCVEESSTGATSRHIDIQHKPFSQEAGDFGHLLSDRYSNNFFDCEHVKCVPRNSCDLANEVFDRQIYESQSYAGNKRSSVVIFNKHDPVKDFAGVFDEARNLYYEYMFADADIDVRLPGTKPSYMDLTKFGRLGGEDSRYDTSEQPVLIPETVRVEKPTIMLTIWTEDTQTVQCMDSNDNETEVAKEEILSIQDFAIATMGVDTIPCNQHFLNIASLGASTNPLSCKNQSPDGNSSRISNQMWTCVTPCNANTSKHNVDIEDAYGPDETRIFHNYKILAKASEQSLCSAASQNSVSFFRTSGNSSLNAIKPAAASSGNVDTASLGYSHCQPLFALQIPTLNPKKSRGVSRKRFSRIDSGNQISSSLSKSRSVTINRANSQAKLLVIKKRSARDSFPTRSTNLVGGAQKGLCSLKKKVCVRGSESIGQEKTQNSKHLYISVTSVSSESLNSQKVAPGSIGSSSSQTLQISSALNGYQGQFEMQLPNNSNYMVSSSHCVKFGQRMHPNGEFIHTAFMLDPRSNARDFTSDNVNNDDTLFNILCHADQKSIEAASDAIAAHRSQSQENLRREGHRECSTARLEGVPVGFYRYFQGHLTVEEYKDAKMCVCWSTCFCNKLCTLYGDMICPCHNAIVLEED